MQFLLSSPQTSHCSVRFVAMAAAEADSLSGMISVVALGEEASKKRLADDSET